MEKGTWVKIFLGLTFAAITMELVAVLDSSDNTIPWTTLIIENIPAWVGLPAIGAFCVWLFFHFKKHYGAKKKK